MVSLGKYYLWFFLWCSGLGLLAGFMAALLPAGIGDILMTVPYLAAMVIVLYKFLQEQRRAPTNQERNQFSMLFIFIFWLYSLLAMLLSLLYFSSKDIQVWQALLLNISQVSFWSNILLILVFLSIPMFFITRWFYGPQAQRMAQHMFK